MQKATFILVDVTLRLRALGVDVLAGERTRPYEPRGGLRVAGGAKRAGLRSWTLHETCRCYSLVAIVLFLVFPVLDAHVLGRNGV